MLKRLGTTGILGVVLLLAGLGIVAYQAPIVAAGLAFVLAGVGLVAQGIVKSAMQAFGFA
ncbi:hypothetical protein AUR64_01020 [Haloprofundus marisrubri]|uniref:Uncharacterized protein n=1 Tax=Haloprofundus marisrubri TaxID=1514971 RepID=A0A0W1R453_9EURY|nr:hypothetical protein [Haloprofundus marisrubri]KTG08185.1 hypothetical protein AUR64_01020 [Haloprofundus marisrubri]